MQIMPSYLIIMKYLGNYNQFDKINHKYIKSNEKAKNVKSQQNFKNSKNPLEKNAEIVSENILFFF